MKISEKCTVTRRLRCKLPYFDGDLTEEMNLFCTSLYAHASKYASSDSFPNGGVYFISYEARSEKALTLTFHLSLRLSDGTRRSRELVTVWKRGMLRRMNVKQLYLSR